MVGRFENDLLRLHAHYKNGYLPESGGVLEQSHYIMQAMALIDGVLADG